jgi:hypothetical protein
MEDRPRFQTGPEKFGRPGLSGGLEKRGQGGTVHPPSHTEKARIVTLHLYTGAPELYPNNPTPQRHRLHHAEGHTHRESAGDSGRPGSELAAAREQRKNRRQRAA